jgi:hypothetical protein
MIAAVRPPSSSVCLFHARKPAAHQADQEVVVIVGLGLRRADAVEILEQRDHPVRDRGTRGAIALALARLSSSVGHVHPPHWLRLAVWMLALSR